MINILLLFIVSLIINLKTTRDLQLSKYKINEFKPYFKYYLGLIVSIIMVIILLLTIDIQLFNDLIFYLSLIILGVLATIKLINLKVKPKFTKRYLRLLYIVSFFNLLTTLFSLSLSKSSGVFLILPINIIESFIINGILFYPETINNKKKIIENTKVLRNSDITVIGITGSFGKTTVKEILYQLLSINYEVVKTDGNRNTPLGISLSCNKITNNTKYFIAEMGARHKGDIKELVELASPKIGIITGVNNQHIESFKTEENIYNEKKELAIGVENGVLIVNGSNDNSTKIYHESKCNKKYIIGLNDKFQDLYAKDITISNKNTIFTLVYKEKVIQVKTNFLGIHNVTNILLATKTALLLGVKIEDIIKKIEAISPTENRMNIIESNGITIIDDSYNANIDGVISGLKILKNALGRRIILAQGIVENTKETNQKVGKEIANSCDIAILIGKNRKDLEKGLKDENFDGRIYLYKTLKVAQSKLKDILKYGDTVYIQNDLVD